MRTTVALALAALASAGCLDFRDDGYYACEQGTRCEPSWHPTGKPLTFPNEVVGLASGVDADRTPLVAAVTRDAEGKRVTSAWQLTDTSSWVELGIGNLSPYDGSNDGWPGTFFHADGERVVLGALETVGGGGTRLHLFEGTGGAWSGGDPLSSASPIDSVNLAVSGTETFVAYRGTDPVVPTNRRIYVARASAAWAPSPPVPVRGSGVFMVGTLALTTDLNGDPVVAVAEEMPGPSGSPYWVHTYRLPSSGSSLWEHLGSFPSDGATGTVVELTRNAAGEMVLGYLEQGPNSAYGIAIYRHRAGTWQRLGAYVNAALESEGADHLSLMAEGDDVWVSWTQRNARIRVSRWNNTAWVNELEFQTSSPQRPSALGRAADLGIPVFVHFGLQAADFRYRR
jgi:hypothetical protein